MQHIEQCYGVVVVLKKEINKFLILERAETKGDWTFPKGHTEKGEAPIETALRELREETGIEEINIIEAPILHEEYEIIRGGEKRLKMNDYFIGIVNKDNVQIEEKEIQSYKWANYEESFNCFKYERRRQILKEAKIFLEKYVKIEK